MALSGPASKLAFCVSVVATLVVSTGLAFADGRGDGRPPAGQAAPNPGDVISAEPFTAYTDPARLTPLPAHGWKVLYRSTSATGQPNQVSGVILVPEAEWRGTGERPVVGYSVGTHGLGDHCAPSYQLARGTDYEAAAIRNLLNQGWAVAVTDYEGLGTPGVHTYSVGRSEGQAVLDVVRAAVRLPAAGLSADAPVGLWGYSQGGQSTGWGAQLAPTYAPGLSVVGAAPGGVPADLVAVGESLDGGPFAGLAFAAALGFDAAYPELNLERYLNAAGKAMAEDGKDDCVDDAIAKAAFTNREDYAHTDPLSNPNWRRRLGENRLGGASAPAVPVFLYHGPADEIVPYQQAAQLRKEWCGNGVTVHWQAYPGEHLATYAEAQPFATAWLHSRFAGLPAPSNCGLR